jgi:hypothetical protein
MYRGYLRYFIGFFVTIGLIIVLIVLLFGGGGDKKTSDTPEAPKTLSSIADTDAQVRMTIAGAVRSNQEYTEVQVTVDRNSANLDIISGFEGNVVDSQNFASNQPAYETFLRALTHAGYMLGEKGAKGKLYADDRGYCPTGQRYIFEIIENGKTVQRYWSSSCGKSAPKTYLGTTSLTITLFQRQIPEYNTLTDDVIF